MTGSVYLNMKSIKDRVKKLLANQKHLRDDDNSLVANFWYYEMKDLKIDPEAISAMELMKIFSEGKLTPVKSIERCRRKLQEQNPDLRGKNYKKRQKEEKDVRENIKDL